MSRKKPRSVPSIPASVGVFPSVAILGRPNVGKSTLFNRMVGRAAAIVEDRPGVTRDRLFADTSIDDKPILLIDMGGFEFAPDGTVEMGISRQCLKGVEQADLVLFVVDGRVPPTNGDFETVEMLRKSGKPSILVINKVDGEKFEHASGDVYALGLEPAVHISALHGRGMSDLEDLIYAALPQHEGIYEDESEAETDDVFRAAVIGRPNAGKSSLINSLLGEERLLTLDEPGTTRDPVDSMVEVNGRRIVLIDTAGIRRKRSVGETGAEKLAVSAAVRAMERSHVVVLLIDANEGPTEQDAKVLGLAVERGRAVVVGLNKWDLVVNRDSKEKKALVEKIDDVLSFCKWPVQVKISAKSGENTESLIAAVISAFDEFNKRASTGQVNRLMEDIIEHHPPPMNKGKAVKLYYATQASTRPPSFVVYTNYPDAIHFSYKRYIENRLRETFGFEGSPVRIFFRARKRRD
jgi:GTP-binding protein